MGRGIVDVVAVFARAHPEFAVIILCQGGEKVLGKQRGGFIAGRGAPAGGRAAGAAGDLVGKIAAADKGPRVAVIGAAGQAR